MSRTAFLTLPPQRSEKLVKSSPKKAKFTKKEEQALLRLHGEFRAYDQSGTVRDLGMEAVLLGFEDEFEWKPDHNSVLAFLLPEKAFSF